jgi:hypothetical protein
MDYQSRKSSFFWPVILVGAGVILLLKNFGVLQDFNFHILFRLWPLILVVIGVDLIFGRRFPWAGALIGLLTVGAVIAFLYFAPSLGINQSAGIRTEVLSEPLGNAVSVEYRLDTAAEPVFISALPDSSDIFKATVVHRGYMNYNVTGATNKTVTLSQTTTSEDWFSVIPGLVNLKWDIGLTPAVPVVVNLDGGSGALRVDLEGLNLEALRADLGSGASDFTLPESSTPYTVEIDSGSGAVNLSLADDTGLSLTLSSSSGAVNMWVPQGAALKVEVLDGGSGSMRLPTDLELVRGSGKFENDTWQSAGFDDAEIQVIIRIADRGSGSITIHR